MIPLAECVLFCVTFCMCLLFRHLSAKNFSHMGKSVQILLSQVQKYVYDYNMGKMGRSSEQDSFSLNSSGDSYKNYEWNFPGLRKNLAASPTGQIEDEIKCFDHDGIKELVLLQQRNVLQV